MTHPVTKYCLGILALCISASSLFAQAPADSTAAADTSLYTIGEVSLSGNKKTKAFIILREIPFAKGEQYSPKDLEKKMEDARQQLLNTSLFHSVLVTMKNIEKYNASIHVEVKERWYLFPSLYFKPVDRNLNQWLVEQKADLSRVNLGVKLRYYNATGRNDKIRGTIGFGYTRQFAINYERPYIDKRLKWGLAVGFSTGKNKEVNYNTINDKQVFIKDDNIFLNNFTNGFAQFTYRRKIKTRHSFGIAYTTRSVRDTVVALNPSYFQSGNHRVSYPELFYTLTYFDVDFIPYPTKGYALQASFAKRGLNEDVNLWQLAFKGSGSWHLNNKMFFNLNLYAGMKAPFKQPYSHQQFLGYGDAVMQGYEYYVIDGVAGGYLKSTLFHELINFKVKVPQLKKAKEPFRIPFRIVGKVFGNTGYVHNPQPGDNLLSNKMLYSGGFGIDIVTFYDITLKVEYSFNQLGENGLFLHKKSIF